MKIARTPTTKERAFLDRLRAQRVTEYRAQWPKAAIPGRTREELAAASAASIIAPNAEAMRDELARRDN